MGEASSYTRWPQKQHHGCHADEQQQQQQQQREQGWQAGHVDEQQQQQRQEKQGWQAGQWPALEESLFC